ncbi:3,4-dihydroxy-2-butanone-4-phosphate synthase [Candidatus Peregrinibacteria bacterium]|nr:3,4-dihydroxy-2-butanone-4-phosphate synthase [Candidatus Peregrinibacteria bacterium]
MTQFSSVEKALTALKAGKMIIVVDDEKRENEGDLVMAASKATPEAVNFMMKEARGLICAPIARNIAERLCLRPMVNENTESAKTHFTVSVDFKMGTTTGISASDRSKTIKALADSKSVPGDFLRPGHIFPLIAEDAGVMKRRGHTEAAVDLVRMAGLAPAAFICEIAQDDGEMMRLANLKIFAKKHNLELISIEDLINYRTLTENFVVMDTSAKMPTKFGDFDMQIFKTTFDNQEAIVLTHGKKKKGATPYVRVHSECFTGETLHSKRCDCGEQLDTALKFLSGVDYGMIIYLHQEGRGIGLANKIKAYHLQDMGMDTYDANVKLGFAPDARDYFLASQILKFYKIDAVNLLTNNPHKIENLEAYGIRVEKRVPIAMVPNVVNDEYLHVKKIKFHHILPNAKK